MIAVPPDVQSALSSADLISRTYSPGCGRESADPINFVLIGGTDRSALHDPRSCLIGAGMQLENDHVERLPGTACGGARLPGRRPAWTSPGTIFFTYTSSMEKSQSGHPDSRRHALERLLGRRGTPVYFLRFTRPLDSDPQLDSADHARLQQICDGDVDTRFSPG